MYGGEKFPHLKFVAQNFNGQVKCQYMDNGIYSTAVLYVVIVYHCSTYIQCFISIRSAYQLHHDPLCLCMLLLRVKL